MKKRFTLIATLVAFLSVSATDYMFLKLKDGSVKQYNVENIEEAWFSDEDSSVADVSAYAPLEFLIETDSTVELVSGEYKKLDSINIPSKVKIDGKVYSVTSIGGGAFVGCSRLTSIKIPSSVKTIYGYAFDGCSSLTSIEIPSSVTSFEYAFYGCSSLESIKVDTNNPNYSSIDGIVYNKEKTEIKVVPEGIKGSISIPSGVTEIGSSAFYNCSSLTSIEIPSSVTEIGSSAFYNCSSLASIEIPSSVTEIGSSAFYNCSSLASIEIPSSVTEIGDRAFYKCSSLTSIEIPSSVIEIGESAFFICNLLDIEIDNSEKNVVLGIDAFWGVKSVKWLKD